MLGYNDEWTRSIQQNFNTDQTQGRVSIFMEIITKSISNKDNSQQVAVAVAVVLTQNVRLFAQILDRI